VRSEEACDAGDEIGGQQVEFIPSSGPKSQRSSSL
jgi:hypothetical protein